jgi:hypothetical protein
MITIPASRSTTRHGVSPATAAASCVPRRLWAGPSRGTGIYRCDFQQTAAAMREFRQRYPQVWSEDIGGW